MCHFSNAPFGRFLSPTSVLLPIFIRGQALRIQIRSHALCPSHFKTTFCIAPLFSVNIFTSGVLCPNTKELTFLRMFVRVHVCVCLHACTHTHTHASALTKSFSISICVSTFIFQCPLFCSHKWKGQHPLLQLCAFTP